MPNIDIMKAVADVESGPTMNPSPKIKDKSPTKKKTKKVAKKQNADLFSVIGNPSKMSEKPQTKKKKKYQESMDDSLSIPSFGDDSEMGSEDFSEDSVVSESSFEGRQKMTMRKRKEEIMQEKIEMLTRISNMSRSGFTTAKKWSMKDGIDDIRFECYRMTREKNSKNAVKYMQHMLITVANILELANGIMNPFNMKLQGFSKSLMLTVSDYDSNLEELHHKWSGRTSLGPEMQILLTFVMSAVYHHAGNTMNSYNETSSSSKPDLGSLLGVFSKMMPKPVHKTPMRDPTPEPVKEQVEVKTRRPMKGPSTSLDGVLPSMKVPDLK